MMLIESAVLHDRIFYLPAMLANPAGSSLRSLLLQEGILQVLPRRDDHDLIRRALLASFGTAEEFRSFSGRRIEQLASAPRVTAEEVSREFEDSTVFIPPFSALVLSRASTPADIPAEILALRAEYSGFRRTMNDLERERAAAGSLAVRMKVLRQILGGRDQSSGGRRGTSRPKPVSSMPEYVSFS